MTNKFHNRYTNKELIDILIEFNKKEGRPPRANDFKNCLPNTSTFLSRFGKWESVLSAAGLKKGKFRDSAFTNDELISYLVSIYDKYGKVPTNRDLKKYNLPSNNTYIKHFGSFKNALIIAGLFDLRKDKHQFCNTYTDEEMLDNLREYMKSKDRIPVHSIIKKELSNPSISAYEKRFYSIFNAFKMIGYDYNAQKEQDLIELEHDMLFKYKLLKERLGRVPSSRDIDYYCKNDKSIYSMSSYEFHFGSLYELQTLCDFTPTVIGRNKSREDLLDDLLRVSYELGRTPSQNDLKYFDDVASYCKYSHEFGSWNESVRLAGLKPNNEFYYSTKGVECYSYYELLFTNMLEEYNIDFLKEEPYKKYVNTNRLYRFDYIIKNSGKRYFIEIFGITSKPDYQERTKNKINLCKENNLNLIEIYPDDFTTYKLDEIHKMFMSKIN